MNRACSTVQTCANGNPDGATVYLKHVDGGLVLAVTFFCILVVAIHVVALRRHERSES